MIEPSILARQRNLWAVFEVLRWILLELGCVVEHARRGQATCAGKIEFVCPDMWRPCLRVIRERGSNALNILDLFHIGAKMNDALDGVRAGEARKLVQDGFEPVLTKTRWCVLKRKENLTGNQRVRLSITYLANFLSHNSPTDFTDEAYLVVLCAEAIRWFPTARLTPKAAAGIPHKA